MNHRFPPYEHFQFGTLMISVFLGVFGLQLVLFFIMGAGYYPESIWIITFLVIFWGLLTALFYGLRVRVTDETIRIAFGIGLIHKTIALSSVISAQPVHMIGCGWGLRYLGKGSWMWNVSGFDSVELTLTNGKGFRIGTNDPEGLHQAIQARLTRV